jgi:hypothetical protein
MQVESKRPIGPDPIIRKLKVLNKAITRENYLKLMGVDTTEPIDFEIESQLPRELQK